MKSGISTIFTTEDCTLTLHSFQNRSIKHDYYEPLLQQEPNGVIVRQVRLKNLTCKNFSAGKKKCKNVNIFIDTTKKPAYFYTEKKLFESSTSIWADSTDSLVSLSPSIPIGLCFWRVFITVSSVYTELI